MKRTGGVCGMGLAALLMLALAGCGGGNGAGGPHVFVSNFGGNSVTSFPAGSGGNMVPAAILTGTNTGLSGPEGLTVDASGNLYVSNFNGNSIEQFAAGARNNGNPAFTIAGNLTGLSGPTALAIDTAGNLYTTNFTANSKAGSVTVYATPPSGQNVAPRLTISGTASMLNGPAGIALDSNGNIYVSNRGNNTVTIYTPLGTAPTAPSLTLSGTSFNLPTGIAVDANFTIYVANQGNNSITIYTLQSNQYMLAGTIMGGATGLSNPFGLALDSASDIYVANNGDATVTEYPPGQVGNLAPLNQIGGNFTQLNLPSGVAIF